MTEPEQEPRALLVALAGCDDPDYLREVRRAALTFVHAIDGRLQRLAAARDNRRETPTERIRQ